MTTYVVEISKSGAALLAVLMDRAGQDRVEITEAELVALDGSVKARVDVVSSTMIVERVK